MTIESKFNLGDKVWTIGYNLKAAEIQIGLISYGDGGIRYVDNATYQSYYEDRCFATKEELMKYVAEE